MKLRKIISALSPIVLIAGTVAIIPINAAQAHTYVGTGGTNTAVTQGNKDRSLFVAVQTATSAVSHASSVVAAGHTDARSSTGLVFKDASSGAAQIATVTVGSTLSLYSQVSTSSAFSADGGTFSVSATASGMTMTADNYISGASKVFFSPTVNAPTWARATFATPVAVLYTAPSTVGTYTVTFAVATVETGITAGPTLAAPTLGTSHTLTVSVIAEATTTAHSAPGGSNNIVTSSRANSALYVAVESSTTTAAVVGGPSSIQTVHTNARSKGLLSKDSSNGSAQTATVLAGAQLSLYAHVSTASAFNASGGSFSSGAPAKIGESVYYNASNNYLGLGTSTTATGVAAIWTAPTTTGTYTVSLLTGFATDSSGSSVNPSSTNELQPPTLSGQITVSVVAASAGGSFSAAYSACQTSVYLAALSSAALVNGIDSTYSMENGASWAIAMKLRDGYNANLSSGNIVASATNGALLSWGTAGTVTATPLAGTGSTVVAYRTGELDALRISQPTAGAPLTTTVTITYNGATVCTKTVSIAGKVASLEVSNIQTQDLSLGTHATDLDESGRTTGQLFQVVAKDSAGNRVATSGLGTFSADSASLLAAGGVVLAASVAHSATAVSSSSKYSYSTGLYTCGAAAGSAKMKLKFTTTSTGEAVTSPEFTLRCADNPYTYTASWDKASYVQGDIATLTVKFLDSKGNAANNVVSYGYSTIVAPMLTAVSATGAASVSDNAGVKTYTFTVGTSTGMTAGTYTSIIDFTGLTAVAAVKSTPTYKLTAATTDVEFSEILKSVVALIASINKQIQALQKLILKR
jgi:hypothetical protein